MSEDTKVRSESPELAAMTLPQLKKVATQLGIDGAAKMAKGSLVDAIADLQAKNREAAKAEKEAARAERDARRAERNNDKKENNQENSDRSDRNDRNDRNDRDDNEDGGSRRNRDRHRGRDRDRNRNREDRGEPTISEDDVLLPVGGLLDILENYAFVRTSGYLPSPNDVYVSMQQVRKFALRKGDVITGQVKQPREGERREKFNALVRIDSINGVSPEESRNRVDFTKLVPLYPQERLRLETQPNISGGTLVQSEIIVPQENESILEVETEPEPGEKENSEGDNSNNSNSDSKLILIGKKVVDISSLLNNHPGGNSCLIKKLGIDCSKDIYYHSKNAMFTNNLFLSFLLENKLLKINIGY